MKILTIISCLFVLSINIFGQQIKTKDAEFEDYIPLLNASGYEVFSFNMSEILKDIPHYYLIGVTLNKREK